MNKEPFNDNDLEHTGSPWAPDPLDPNAERNELRVELQDREFVIRSNITEIERLRSQIKSMTLEFEQIARMNIAKSECAWEMQKIAQAALESGKK